MKRLVMLALGLCLCFLVPACSDDQPADDAADHDFAPPVVGNATIEPMDEAARPDSGSSATEPSVQIPLDEAASNSLAAPVVGNATVAPENEQ